MDLEKILAELRDERAAIEQAILALERLGRGGARRGRPPKWLAGLLTNEPSSKPAGKRAAKPSE